MSKRNVLVFEAPNEMTKQTKKLAKIKMVSTSAICRQALERFLTESYEKDFRLSH